MVLIGRPYIYGLAIGGFEGVQHVIRTFLGDLEVTMHQAGVKSVRDLIGNRHFLYREPYDSHR
jgi:lactate 2-monooxygenase